MNKNFQEKIKKYLKSFGVKVLTLVVLIFVVWGTMRVYSDFQEPLTNSSSSDQDFAENILGANNSDNDFDSSNAVSNRDGSILERLEYLIGSSCGNGTVEAGEGCDDGGTSWTSGACAGDCSQRNYWSSPSVAGVLLGAGTLYGDNNANAYCQSRKFRLVNSYNTTTGAGLVNFLNIFSNVLSISSSTASSSSGSQTTATLSSGASSSSTTRSGAIIYTTYYDYRYTTTLYSTSNAIASNSTSSYFFSTWQGNGFRIYQTTQSITGLSGSSSWTTASSNSVTSSIQSSTTSNIISRYFSTFITSMLGTHSSSYYASSYFQETMQPSTSVIISEIWCAD